MIFTAIDNFYEFGEEFFELWCLFNGSFDGIMDKNVYEKSFFMSASFFLYMVLINLIIAYMSDSYKTVMDNLHSRDNREINI